MNEYGYFKEILDGLRNIIKIDDTKKEIQELKDKLADKEKLLIELQNKDDKYNNVAVVIADMLKNRTINTKLPPKAMQDEFKSLIAELIKRDYISIVDVYNLK
ncbi:hypothetical protein [Ligilactobacillus salivarius]|uniref:hypothetical protein n=1 Tax=Ligilactobacillus salivarius TaxID=1624 RepID=UPI0009D9C545|nr:hypothetical protein [Ligilactobacillus salivarius]ATP35451.1 hypothetical protein CR249_04155 [Ligilactobacillus salivarius]OQR02438.1 hypothetical protein B6U49_07815 [Ligilactobacillus salivarius]